MISLRLTCTELYKISFYGRVNVEFHIIEGESP